MGLPVPIYDAQSCYIMIHWY